MASTISYAKIVRNQKDYENDAPLEEKQQEAQNKNNDVTNKSQSLENDDQSFKEVSNVKKVSKILIMAVSY